MLLDGRRSSLIERWSFILKIGGSSLPERGGSFVDGKNWKILCNKSDCKYRYEMKDRGQRSLSDWLLNACTQTYFLATEKATSTPLYCKFSNPYFNIILITYLQNVFLNFTMKI